MIFAELPNFNSQLSFEVPLAKHQLRGLHNTGQYQLEDRLLVAVPDEVYIRFNQVPPPPDDKFGRDDLIDRMNGINRSKRPSFDISSEEALAAQVDALNDEIADVEPLYAFICNGLKAVYGRSSRPVARIALIRGFAIKPEMPLHHLPKVRNVLEDRKGNLGLHTNVSILKEV